MNGKKLYKKTLVGVTTICLFLITGYLILNNTFLSQRYCSQASSINTHWKFLSDSDFALCSASVPSSTIFRDLEKAGYDCVSSTHCLEGTYIDIYENKVMLIEVTYSIHKQDCSIILKFK